MPPKNAPPPPPVPEPAIELDPAVIAAREALERNQAEERRDFEVGENNARGRIQEIEDISWRCVAFEKEKRFNPQAWEKKTANPTPYYVWVKLLTGNRAVPQQRFKLPVNETMMFSTLKDLIYQRAAKNPATASIAAWFEPEYQGIILYGKEIGAPETERPETATVTTAMTTPRQAATTSKKDKEKEAAEAAAAAAALAAAQQPVDVMKEPLKSLGIHQGCTLHLILRTPTPSIQTLPSLIR